MDSDSEKERFQLCNFDLFIGWLHRFPEINFLCNSGRVDIHDGEATFHYINLPEVFAQIITNLTGVVIDLKYLLEVKNSGASRSYIDLKI